MIITENAYKKLSGNTELLYLSREFGLSYYRSPIQDIIKGRELPKEMFAFKTSPPLRYPYRYAHEYFYMIPARDLKVPHEADITVERVRANLNDRIHDLYYWSFDLVSLLIKHYMAPKRVSDISFYAIPAERLYSLLDLHYFDLLDTVHNGEASAIIGGEFNTTKYDVAMEGCFLTDCIPAGTILYHVGIPTYTFLICLLGNTYGVGNEWQKHYDLFTYAMHEALCGYNLPICDFSYIFRDCAYNMLPYSFPIENVYAPYILGETKYEQRILYLQRAYSMFTSCHTNNALFHNAVHEYCYSDVDLLSYLNMALPGVSVGDDNALSLLGLTRLN